VLAALLAPLALVAPLLRLAQPVAARRGLAVGAQDPQPTRFAATGAVATTAADGDPNLPLYVGSSRRLAVRAIDDTAAARLDDALLGLGRRFVGRPPRLLPPGAAPRERLVLDLTAFDQLSFVEQLLALVNSRGVRTRTEAADRFSDHLRQLRYGGGRVEACARLRHPTLWALAAQRRGYLVDLTPFLPGARQRRVPLKALLEDPSAGSRQPLGHGQACGSVVGSRLQLSLADLPLEAVPAALPSLRSGDLFVLRGPMSDRSPDVIGLVDSHRGWVGALLVQPGRGVVRVADLIAIVRSRPGITGVAFLRPLPNQDGKPDR